MLRHIERHVSHLARSRAFYNFLLPRLGYTHYQEWEQGFSMALYRTQSQAMKDDLEPLMQLEQGESCKPLKKAEHYIVFVQTPKSV